LKKLKIDRAKLKDYPRWPVKYQKSVIMVPYPENPREGVCDACGRSVHKGEIKITHLHHHIYAYKMNTVKEDRLKALENCSELCYTCHRIADALRNLLFLREESLDFVIRIAMLLPKALKEKLDIIVPLYLEARKKDKEKLNNFFRNP